MLGFSLDLVNNRVFGCDYKDITCIMVLRDTADVCHESRVKRITKTCSTVDDGLGPLGAVLLEGSLSDEEILLFKQRIS